jgi:hypothetical protein
MTVPQVVMPNIHIPQQLITEAAPMLIHRVNILHMSDVVGLVVKVLVTLVTVKGLLVLIERKSGF